MAVLLAGSLTGQQQQSSPFHGMPTEIGVGKASYRLRCSACHGIHAEGGRGPSLNRGEFSVGDTDLSVYRVIAEGVPGTEMPAFGGRNTEDNIWRIVAYLQSFAPSGGQDPGGDADRGADIFWNRAGCGGCHRVGNRGGVFGPALTRIGRSRSLEHLRESLLEPNSDFDPDYYVVRVVTDSGETIRGIGVGFDEFSAQLRDAAGNFRSFLRDEVQSMEREYVSLMPDSYGTSLAESEQVDVLAYMRSLRGEEDDR